MIDLRSDTVTKPTSSMLEAMMSATVGDDVMGEDETVNRLQNMLADKFGMEAALFFPTGTMSNQAAIRVHALPGDEVVCSENAHIYFYEGGGIASNAGASVRLLRGETGIFDADDVSSNINNRNDSHFARTRLISIENTMNRGGGCCWPMANITSIAEVCRAHQLALHLDGARLFNALVAKGQSPTQYGALFDTISICLSKGLGAPVGSVLLGSRTHIARAHRYRKAMGGGMRQAGYLAAAGIYALENNVERLAEDHRRAKTLADALATYPWIARVMPAETNIVIAHLECAGADLVAYLADNGVKAGTMGPKMVRFVFHLQVTDADLDRVVTLLRKFEG